MGISKILISRRSGKRKLYEEIWDKFIKSTPLEFEEWLVKKVKELGGA